MCKMKNKKTGYHQAKHEAVLTVNREEPLVKTLLSGKNIHQCVTALAAIKKVVVVEAVYVGNLGFVEMMKFMKVATPKQEKLMDKYLEKKQWKKAWELLKKVTGIPLKGR